MQQRPQMFAFRVNPQERKLIQAAAEVRGLTASEYARDTLLDSSRVWLELEVERPASERESHGA